MTNCLISLKISSFGTLETPITDMEINLNEVQNDFFSNVAEQFNVTFTVIVSQNKILVKEHRIIPPMKEIP